MLGFQLTMSAKHRCEFTVIECDPIIAPLSRPVYASFYPHPFSSFFVPPSSACPPACPPSSFSSPSSLFIPSPSFLLVPFFSVSVVLFFASLVLPFSSTYPLLPFPSPFPPPPSLPFLRFLFFPPPLFLSSSTNSRTPGLVENLL